MAEDPALTLSEHLLREAQRFTLYPNRAYRTKTNLKVQELHDRVRHQIINWRKTFMPSGQEGHSLDLLATSTLLDEVYCRDLLREIPKIVERTLSLSKMSLAGIAPGDAVQAESGAIEQLHRAGFGADREARRSMNRQAFGGCLTIK